MSEGRATTGRWLDVEDAAAQLGISKNALRKRLRRGSLEGHKEAGEWRIWLPEEESPAQATASEQHSPRGVPSGTGELVESLQDQIVFLRSELEARRESERELRVLVAQQSERLTDLAGQVRALAAPPEARESPESVSEPQNDPTPVETDHAAPEPSTSLGKQLQGLGRYRDSVAVLVVVIPALVFGVTYLAQLGYQLWGGNLSDVEWREITWRSLLAAAASFAVGALAGAVTMAGTSLLIRRYVPTERQRLVTTLLSVALVVIPWVIFIFILFWTAS